MKSLVWERRNGKGLSDRTLAEIAGLSKSTINNIETEKTSPTLKQLKISPWRMIANSRICLTTSINEGRTVKSGPFFIE